MGEPKALYVAYCLQEVPVIEQLQIPFAKDPGLSWAHPLVYEWFINRFGSPTEPQIAGWPHILARRTTLISAPTGSGKTLAAFLACISQLVDKATSGQLSNRTEVLYVSPLKALSNDIQKNLEGPLKEIKELAEKKKIPMAEIRTAVRTGDTLASERQAMIKKPPHILVTTPESLYILLTAEKSRAMLKSVETVIVDEIHAVADDKRGAHLSISLERLEALTAKKPVRIGLSATQKPIELIAHFLTGARRDDPVVVDVGHRRKLDIAIEVPDSELGPVASNEMWDEIYDRIQKLVLEHRSTLVFVNTRKLCERVAFHLAERMGQEAVGAHHGSLSRKLRLAAERKLKNGEIKVLVATASLELGIDIGFVDLVVQIGSPRAIAVALQRIGRAGHWRGAVPKGRIIATTRDELIECAALARSIKQGELDRILMPVMPLDVLAQQMVAACAAEEWKDEELFELIRGAYPYRDLSRETYNNLVNMLAEGISAERGRYGAHLMHDSVNGRLKGRRGARLAAITSGGAIPDNALFTVVAQPDEAVVGTLDEDFAVESNRGDVILLGNTSWMIHRIEGKTGRVIVEDAHGAPPSVPFWLGEGPSRTEELSEQVAQIRLAVSTIVKDSEKERAQAIEWMMSESNMDTSGAEQAVDYILQGRAVLGDVPTQQTLIAERFFDEGGGMQLIIHSPFGGRINKAWGLALRKRFCQSFNFELQAAATDNGINIALSEKHSFPLQDVFHFLSAESVQHVLEQAVLQSPIFTTRFRWDANRALALLRFQNGKKVPPQIQRMRAEDLLGAVFPDAAACQDNIQGDIKIPDHPLVNEVMKDVLNEAMDIEGLKTILRKIQKGEIRCLAVDTPMPSQFSHEILNANPYAYLDDAPLEERRARAVEMRRVLPPQLLREVGQLDPSAVRKVTEEAWPDIRDADELEDLLKTLVALPEKLAEGFEGEPKEMWGAYFEKLVGQTRASLAVAGGTAFWVPAQKARTFKVIYPDAEFMNIIPAIEEKDPEREHAIALSVRGWMGILGPFTAEKLAQALKLSETEIGLALLQIEASGGIMRGQYTLDSFTGNFTEWCERRLLARIHSLTVGTLRKQIEPVTAAQFVSWLQRWQHVAPGTQLHGERGLLEVLRQLQGFEIAANAWDKQILGRRIANYNPEVLDRLCMKGAIGWGRLSPHPATLEIKEEIESTEPVPLKRHGRKVIPTSVAPITFFLREECDWMLPQHPHAQETESPYLSTSASKVLEVLRVRGASFFADIVRASQLLKAEVETGLWELVAAGLVTADDFDNLRSLIDPKRRSGQGTARFSRPRHSSGRWSVLYQDAPQDRLQAIEAMCWMLLRRYGVVFRDMLARETILPRWRELLIAFRRLEDRGEVRGGRFVSGFLGEQFALPEAVESLRTFRKMEPTGISLTLSAADPLNLIGIVLPGDRVPAVSGKSVTFKDGIAS